MIYILRKAGNFAVTSDIIYRFIKLNSYTNVNKIISIIEFAQFLCNVCIFAYIYISEREYKILSPKFSQLHKHLHVKHFLH